MALLGGLGANVSIELNADSAGSTKAHVDNWSQGDNDSFLQTGNLGPLKFKGEAWGQAYVEYGIVIETPFGDYKATDTVDILERTVFLKFPKQSIDLSLIYPLAF